MKVTELEVEGAYIVEGDTFSDERGYFSRVLCTRGVKDSLRFIPTQTSISYNKNRNTLRGIHFSVFPYAEAKFVTCIEGWVTDVIVDLRPTSKTFKKHSKVQLHGDNMSVFIPKGCGHGFLTLVDETKLLYQITPAYNEEYQRVIRYNDPDLGIGWGDKKNFIMSDKDTNAPLLKEFLI